MNSSSSSNLKKQLLLSKTTTIITSSSQSIINSNNNLKLSSRPLSSSSSSSSSSLFFSSFSKKQQTLFNKDFKTKNDKKEEIFQKNKIITSSSINNNNNNNIREKPKRWRKRRNLYTQKRNLNNKIYYEKCSSSLSSSSSSSTKTTTNNNTSSPSMLSLISSSSSSSGICGSSHLSIDSKNNLTNFYSSSETEIYLEKNKKEEEENNNNCSLKVNNKQQKEIIINNNENNNEVFMLDLSNPELKQFFLQQRRFFRQIYDQQLAALSARLGLIPPPNEESTFIKNLPHQHLGYPPLPPFPPNINYLCNCCCCLANNNNITTINKLTQQKALTDEQMALRIRHSSSGSTKNTEKSNNMLQQQFQHYSSKVPISPSGISRMDVLSERIYDFHQNTEQNQIQLNRKLLLRDQLYYAISPIFPLCGLYIVGSSLNGFGTLHSDLDLCLMITNKDIDQKSDAVVVLSSVMRTLKTAMLVVDQQLIPAKVPILRIKCSGAFSDIVVDLNVNNSVAIRNTHLLCYYSAFDWRVRLIVMVVKEWAKRRGINNASRSSFTSYSLVLMVIHYLQCGANPPVLPSLQMLYPKRFSEKIDVRLLNVSQPLDPLPSQVWNFDQRLSLGELLLGFLHYYAYEFNFETDAISIRMGRKMDRAQAMQNLSPFNTLSQWHCICIEEPFTLSNAAHSIYDERIFQEIKKTFADSYHDLDKHRDLDRFLSELPLQIPTPPVVVNNAVTLNANGCEPINTETTEVENISSDKLDREELSP